MPRNIFKTDTGDFYIARSKKSALKYATINGGSVLRKFKDKELIHIVAEKDLLENKDILKSIKKKDILLCDGPNKYTIMLAGHAKTFVDLFDDGCLAIDTDGIYWKGKTKMTDQNLTEVIAIIDRSGSMAPYVFDTIGGFNTFLKEQRAVPGKIKITLVQFDDQYQIDYDGLDINDVKDLNNESYSPRGSTALYDSVGKTINAVGKRLAETKEEERPSKVIFLIITDGEENASKEFEFSTIKSMVEHQIEKYSWSFVYMGGGDILAQKKQANNIGIPVKNVYGYTANSAGTQAVYSAFSSGLRRARSASLDFSACDSFLNDDEQKQLIKQYGNRRTKSNKLWNFKTYREG